MKKGINLLIILSVLLLIPFISAETTTISDLNITNTNLNTFLYYGNGSQLLGLSSSQISNNYNWLNSTSANYLYYDLTNPFGFYNSTDFSISNYYLNSNPFGFYNSTDFSISNYYLNSNPFGFYNSTTLPSGGTETDPYWTENFTLYNATWSASGGGSSGNPFDQSLNTTDNVSFNILDFKDKITFDGNPFAFYDGSSGVESFGIGGNTGAPIKYNMYVGEKAGGGTIDTVNARNTFIGYEAGYDSGGYSGVFIGNSAGKNSSGGYGIYIGANSGYLGKGEFNVGYQAGKYAQSNHGMYMGYNAGYRTSLGGGTRVTAIGYSAYSTGEASYFTCVGELCGVSATSTYGSYFGYLSGYQSTGNNGIGIGRQSAVSNTGAKVTALGDSTAYSNSGANLVVIGYESGHGNSGDDGVYIGYQAGKSNTVDDQFILKQANVNTMPLIQGNFATGLVGINTTTPQNTLNVIGDLNVTGNYINGANTGYTGYCVNVTYSGGIAISCND